MFESPLNPGNKGTLAIIYVCTVQCVMYVLTHVRIINNQKSICSGAFLNRLQVNTLNSVYIGARKNLLEFYR